MKTRRPVAPLATGLTVVLTELSCTGAGHQEAGAPAATVVLSATPPASAEAPPEPSAGAIAAEKLRPYVVAHARAARRTLYTWTTRAQVEELARDRVLLTRTESPVHGPAYSDQVIAARAAAGDRLAALLRTSAFARARHAWPAPFATLLGWPGETYGDELVRVDLKAEAWIAKLRTSAKDWEIVDLDDRPVPLEEVLKSPARLAVVYFVQDTPRPVSKMATYGPMTLDRPPFREYVICNESMIERWSVGTAEIARELTLEADAIDALRRHFMANRADAPPLHAWSAQMAGSIWPAGPSDGSPVAIYEGTLAFANELYQPSAEALAALAERLRAVAPRSPLRGHPAIEHRPTAVFPAASASAPRVQPPPPPKKPRQRPRGTY